MAPAEGEAPGAAAVGAFFRKHLVSSCGLPSCRGCCCCCCCWGHLRRPPPLAAVADGAEFYLPVTPARVPNSGQPRDSTVHVPLAFKHLQQKLDFFVLLPATHHSHSSQYLAIAYLICCPTAAVVATAPLRWNRPPPREPIPEQEFHTQILLVLINQKRMCPLHTDTDRLSAAPLPLIRPVKVATPLPPSNLLWDPYTDTHKHTHSHGEYLLPAGTTHK